MRALRSSSTVFFAIVLLSACGNGPDDGTTMMTGGGGNGATGSAGNGGSMSTSPCAEAPGPETGAVDVTFLPNVTVTTIAGSDVAGDADGPGASAQFSNPVSVLVEPSGSIVVADFDNDRLRRINADGTVSTLTHQFDFQRPFGLARGADGTLFVHTDYNSAGEKTGQTGTVWRVDAQSGLAVVAGANLGRPRSLAARADGKLVLGDYQNHRVRVLDPVSGSVEELVPDACALDSAGTMTASPFGMPYGVVVLPDQTIVVSDADLHRLRAVTAAGAVSTFAGGEKGGTIDADTLSARFSRPAVLAMDGAGNIYVSDTNGHRIRRVGTDGQVTTVAGDGTAGHRDGAGASAQFFGQEGLTVTADGHTLYVADGTGGEPNLPYHRVRKIVIGGGGVTP